MSPARILVVDNDPWIQRMVATVLGQRGHVVSLAGDAQGALATASKVPPDLVITTVTLPAVDGWAWWERLRARPEFAETPLLFLIPSPDPGEAIRGVQPGRDGHLAKPFRVEDLERAVQAVLEATARRDAATATGGGAVGQAAVPRRTRSSIAHKPSAGHRPLSALRGDMDQIALSSVLVLLEMERKTGILLLERGEASARLFLRKGRVVRADVEGARTLAGAAAVYEALTWTDGSFDFLLGDVGGVDDIQASTTFLLMEGARRLDERNHERNERTERETSS